MIIKQPDSRKSDLEALRSILAREGLTTETRTAVEQEIHRIELGMKGENESRRQINFYFGASKYWAVIHDLRIDLGQGQIAQIDHLVINRFLQFWICESKFKSGALSVNEHGEFSVMTNAGPIGIPSPIEQGRRQAAVLEKALQNHVRMPRRFGLRIIPIIETLVLLSTNTIIQRPQVKFEGSASLIKNDAIRTATLRQWEDMNPAVQTVKIIYWFMDRFVRHATLMEIANQVAKLHRPAKYDWQRKLAATAAKPDLPSAASLSTASEIEQKLAGRLTCEKCGDMVSRSVAKFCLAAPHRFGGKVYCYTDQKDF